LQFVDDEGRQIAAKKVERRRPGLRETHEFKLKVLYMSGYTDAQGTQVTLDPATPFLQKPFTPTVFMNKVQEVLEKHVS